MNPGQYKPKASNINLRTAVEKAVALLKTNIEKKGFAIDIQVPEGLIVAADEDKLNLAFVNLIDNAIKYTPEKGRIGIKAEARGKEVMVSVSDTGIGIPKRI